ncbi:MAG: proliferating cell nuclear antigen (pcna) [Candidatus Aenigmarchaeota archaeon]|nr:proliferating cell nuclear antigen (pcna) [Candidatus Aenigmarchaeota archaeon]
MMFEAQIDDLTILKDSMSAISELIDETDLIIRKDGIKMVASDRAVIAVVDFFLSRNAFSKYEYNNDLRIGINLANFLRILKRAMPNDIMKIRIKDNKFEIKLSGDSQRSFMLPIIDVSKEDIPPIDKLDFHSSFEINNEILSNGIEDADLITDSLVFNVNQEGISLKAESDSSSAELELVPGNSLKSLTIKQPTRARYSLDYLKKIIKAKRLSESAVIHMSTDYPLKIMFSVPEKIQLNFILAPRVEE